MESRFYSPTPFAVSVVAAGVPRHRPRCMARFWGTSEGVDGRCRCTKQKFSEFSRFYSHSRFYSGECAPFEILLYVFYYDHGASITGIHSGGRAVWMVLGLCESASQKFFEILFSRSATIPQRQEKISRFFIQTRKNFKPSAFCQF